MPARSWKFAVKGRVELFVFENGSQKRSRRRSRQSHADVASLPSGDPSSDVWQLFPYDAEPPSRARL